MKTKKPVIHLGRQASYMLWYFVKTVRCLSIPKWDGIGTFCNCSDCRVAKASSGHFPLPFLISISKELVQM